MILLINFSVREEKHDQNESIDNTDAHDRHASRFLHACQEDHHGHACIRCFPEGIGSTGRSEGVPDSGLSPFKTRSMEKSMKKLFITLTVLLVAAVAVFACAPRISNGEADTELDSTGTHVWCTDEECCNEMRKEGICHMCTEYGEWWCCDGKDHEHCHENAGGCWGRWCGHDDDHSSHHGCRRGHRSWGCHEDARPQRGCRRGRHC